MTEPSRAALRSLMFVPSHQERMVDRALGTAELDVAILDLEDGVPYAERAGGRARLATLLESRPTMPGPARYVRVNAPNTNDLVADLDAVVRAGLDGVVLPKVDSTDDLRAAVAALQAREREAGVAAVALLVSIESARGLLAAPALAAEPRVTGLLFGAEDFALDLGLPAEREAEASDLLHARSSVVVAAAASRRVAIDGIWPDLTDEDGLRADARRGRLLGFVGKTLIHPKQIQTINECFTPSAAELEEARRIVEAFERAKADGKGAVAFDGKLLDPPIVDRARRMIGAARK
ncbi:MAG: CoA ester lyase [Chloroflexi bacterium]|nr:MAG: CoA ester lyase [Chloroflexota bacterium]